jgi:hypothetical protein
MEKSETNAARASAPAVAFRIIGYALLLGLLVYLLLCLLTLWPAAVSIDVSKNSPSSAPVFVIRGNWRVNDLRYAEFIDDSTGSVLWSLRFVKPVRLLELEYGVLPDGAGPFEPDGKIAPPKELSRRVRVIVGYQYDTAFPPAACGGISQKVLVLK